MCFFMGYSVYGIVVGRPIWRNRFAGPSPLTSPDPPGTHRPPAPAPESPQSSPGGSPRYHRVKLEIEAWKRHEETTE